jgi:hypothetical protein
VIAATGIGNSPLFLALITGVLGVFGGGTIIALLKVPADKHRIVVDAAQGAVIVQSGVIETLNTELTRVREQLAEVLGREAVREKRIERLEAVIKRAGLEPPNGNPNQVSG